ncbi:MAG: hypothetical protein DMD41_14385 [Gemmatimonadetes bacterium]|nr:MAG: hypothetical protein DMD41_14385 [Gemmatimonadota bacterium]
MGHQAHHPLAPRALRRHGLPRPSAGRRNPALGPDRRHRGRVRRPDHHPPVSRGILTRSGARARRGLSRAVVGGGLHRLLRVARPIADCDNGGLLHSGTLTPAEERRTGLDRRTGRERRSGAERRAECRRTTDAGHRLLHRSIWVGTEPGGLSLRRLFPHAQFSDAEAAERLAGIAAHRRELDASVGRDVGPSVAALDYLLNISGDLADPTIVEHEVLEVVERRSVTDPLTGLFNRYHFEATLRREVARCTRYGTRLSLLLMDVDQLKAVNDRWGHQAGDRVLGRVARAIQTSLRGTDIASRHGGDEFAIVLPDTDARAGRLVAERICAKVQASRGEGNVPDASTRVTVSGGLAELPLAAPSAAEAQLLVAADRALYLAKGRGGNHVAEATP